MGKTPRSSRHKKAADSSLHLPTDLRRICTLYTHSRFIAVDSIQTTMASPQQLRTKLTDLLKIQHPVMLAGMNVAAGPKLAAAVTNAGGLGVIGGVGYTPDMLREQIAELKGYLNDQNAPFGIDLLLPQVGGSACKTNYDYTKGKLNELVDIIIDSGAKLFVSAVGVPPKAVVERLHKAGILYMNMIGHPKHIKKCLDIGVDIICAQGGEGGGHTGDVPTSVFIPAAVKMVEGHKSPLTGEQVQIVAAGGIFNGQSLAAMLTFGATGVWVGTRFILSRRLVRPRHTKKLSKQLAGTTTSVPSSSLADHFVFATTHMSPTGRRTDKQRSRSSPARVYYLSSTILRRWVMTSTMRPWTMLGHS